MSAGVVNTFHACTITFLLTYRHRCVSIRRNVHGDQSNDVEMWRTEAQLVVAYKDRCAHVADC